MNESGKAGGIGDESNVGSNSVQQQQQQPNATQQSTVVATQQQNTVPGAMASPGGCVVTSTMSSLNQANLQMQQSQQQSQQTQPPQAIAPAPSPSQQAPGVSHSSANTVTTMSPIHANAIQQQQQQQHSMVTPNPQQQQAMNQHTVGSGVPSHPGATMQQVQDWHGQRVQLIQSPQQNPMYLQQVYNTQSGQLLMPSNIALHSAGMNQPIQSMPGLASFQFQTKPGGGAMVPVSCGPTTLGKLPSGHTLLPAAAAAQVIAATGKPFQTGQMTPHLLTTQGKPVLQAGQATASFPGYIPTSTNQTLVISHMGVISSQPNILPANSNTAGKQEMSKMMQNAKGQVVAANGVNTKPNQGNQGQGSQVVSQPQLITTQAPTAAMLGNQAQLISPIQQFQWQFSPSLPQGLWTAPGALPSQLLTTQNPIFIRGGQQDGQQMFIQNAPPQGMPTHNPTLTPQTTNMTGSPQIQQKAVRQNMEMPANIQPKVTTVPQQRLSTILPSGGPNIRPASSVSTQTSSSTSTAAGQTSQKSQGKVRSKLSTNRTSPGPGGGTLKADAANQTKPQQMGHGTQHQIIVNNRVMLNNAGGTTSVSSQLPVPNNMQGGMLVTSGDNKTMMTAAPQMMSKLVPISMQQQHQIAQSMVAAQQQHLGHPQQIHLVPQQSVQPLQQQHQISQQQTHHKIVMGGANDKPVMPVTAAVMTSVMPGTLMPGTSILSNSQLLQQGMMAPSQNLAQQGIMSQHPSMLTPMQPPLSVPAGLTVASVPTATVSSMISPPTSVSSSSTLPMMASTVGVSQPQRDEHSQQQTNNITGSSLPAVNNSLSSDIATSHQNGVQPMDVTESPETPESVATKDDKDKATNGDSETGIDDGKDKGRLKALVKPQVLTHVIEGFVIQEASEPFSMSRSGISHESPPTRQNHSSDKENQANDTCEPPKKRPTMETQTQASPRGELAKCEFCGKVDLRSKFKKSKRFCSLACAKRFNVSCSKRMLRPAVDPVGGKKPMFKKDQVLPNKPAWQKRGHPANEWSSNSCAVSGSSNSNIIDDATDETNDSGPESSLSPSEAPEVPCVDMEDGNASEAALPIPSRSNPVKWSVSEVCEFIRLLPGCTDYAEDFAIQEIDGQALLLLKADHLMNAMSMKLGPALKICARIEQLRNVGAEK